jgi:hypothetical protein
VGGDGCAGQVFQHGGIPRPRGDDVVVPVVVLAGGEAAPAAELPTNR